MQCIMYVYLLIAHFYKRYRVHINSLFALYRTDGNIEHTIVPLTQ